jgi:predicted metal-dependent phosphotriesterase family hydrolase
VTPADIGRDVRFLQDVSSRSGMQIIVCTGHWLNPALTMAARTVEAHREPQGLRPPTAGLLSWQRRAESVKQLIDAGFVDKLFLSSDWYLGVTMAATGAMDAMDKLNPDGMLFVTRKTIPYLKQLGVTDRQIRTITVDNPRRFFSGA